MSEETMQQNDKRIEELNYKLMAGFDLLGERFSKLEKTWDEGLSRLCGTLDNQVSGLSRLDLKIASLNEEVAKNTVLLLGIS